MPMMYPPGWWPVPGALAIRYPPTRKVVLDADPLFRGRVLDGAPTINRFQSWDNDPPSADRVGSYKQGGRTMALTDKPFASIFTFTRASGATDFDATGNLVSAAPDAIRQGYDPATLLPAGWLLEGATTNAIRDARFEQVNTGVTTTSATTISTYWSFFATNGLSATAVAKGTINGIPYVDFRINGTSTGTAFQLVIDNSSSGLGTLTSSDYLSTSLYLSEPYGGGTGVTGVNLSVSVTGGTTGTVAPGSNVKPSFTGSLARYTYSTPVPGDRTGAWLRLDFALVNGATVDYTIRIGGPQLEKNYFASSLILPPAGAPAPATRAADNLSIGGSVFQQMFGAGAPQGCVFLDVLPGRAAPSSGDQVIAQIDDGTDNNRIVLRNVAGGLTVTGDAMVGGTSGGGTASAGNLVVGTVARVGIRWGGGAIAICKDAGAVQKLTAALPSPTVLRFGNRAALGRAWNSRIRYAGAASFAPSDAKFLAACALGADITAALR